ncbi:hypothetical protein GCM10009117_25780 [Gangjinia marincola]|uniref:Uncharacterized protein n=1 Tax=Gangjinia marincola TaxID=578463 RepID=A0ABN1MJX1_9FLAO
MALVMAAVALIAVTGGMAVAAVANARTALSTAVAVTEVALEVAGCLLTAKALYNYSQDRNEEVLFNEVAVGFLFLGAGAAIFKGYRMYRGRRSRSATNCSAAN